VIEEISECFQHVGDASIVQAWVDADEERGAKNAIRVGEIAHCAVFNLDKPGLPNEIAREKQPCLDVPFLQKRD
jgi:hypothetical protein